LLSIVSRWPIGLVTKAHQEFNINAFNNYQSQIDLFVIFVVVVVKPLNFIETKSSKKPMLDFIA
jgi:hypothetical protein